MAITKGIVSGGNYSFNAAAKTITFSSEYLGMSLSDITYITNIKSGVATVIYDPFDTTKGGVLNGLVLTLAYNTTSMSDSDPLQIIVGFTPDNPKPFNVSITDNSQLESQTELLQDIADNIDLLAASVDGTEGIQVNIRDANPAKRDINNAQVISDGIQYSATLSKLNDVLYFDASGYKSVEYYLLSSGGVVSLSVIPETSSDGIAWVTQVIMDTATSTNQVYASTWAIGANNTKRYYAPVISKYLRLRISAYSSGSIYVVATLKQTPFITGPFTALPTNITTINSTTPSVYSITNVGNQASSSGGISVGGNFAPGSSIVQWPLNVAGREAPYSGVLGGITRMLLTDSQGRYILGGDYDGTRPRDPVTGLAQGPYGNAPTRGVGGIPNNIVGAQSLTVGDVSQSEGDTNTMLLKQILQELKILNQQITELPMIVNTPSYVMSDPQEYRDDKSTLF